MKNNKHENLKFLGTKKIKINNESSSEVIQELPKGLLYSTLVLLHNYKLIRNRIEHINQQNLSFFKKFLTNDYLSIKDEEFLPFKEQINDFILERDLLPKTH